MRKQNDTRTRILYYLLERSRWLRHGDEEEKHTGIRKEKIREVQEAREKRKKILFLFRTRYLKRKFRIPNPAVLTRRIASRPVFENPPVRPFIMQDFLG